MPTLAGVGRAIKKAGGSLSDVASKISKNFPTGSGRANRGLSNAGPAIVSQADKAPTKLADDLDAIDNSSRKADEITAPESHPLGLKPDGNPVTNGENLPPLPDDEAGMTIGQRATKRLRDVQNFFKDRPVFAGLTTSTIIAGVAVTTYLAIAATYYDNTDGVEVKIKKIEKMANTTNRYKFTYETQDGQMCGHTLIKVPCRKAAFNPTKNDSFTFRNTYTTKSLDNVTAMVMAVGDDNISVELEIDGITDLGNGTPEWGYMTCHSSFGNQMRGAFRDTLALVAGAASDALDLTKDAFCDTVHVPFICPSDGSEWMWIVACILLCMCCVFVGLILLQSS